MTTLKPNPKLDLPQCMINGEKFIKWDEVSNDEYFHSIVLIK